MDQLVKNEKLTDYGADGGKQTSEVSSITANVMIINSSRPISYAKLLNGESSRKTVNFRSLLAPDGNGEDVAISTFSSKDGMDAMIENDPWLSYARAMDELRAHVKLKDTLVVFVPKFVDVLKNFKNPSKVVRGVQVGPKLGSKFQFKPTKNVYQPASKKSSASSSGKKKQVGLSRQDVSNSSSFDALDMVKNDDDLVRINDLERQMLDEKIVLVDDDGKQLKKVDDPVNADCNSEVDEVFNEIVGFMASTSFEVNKNDSNVGNKSLYE
nr:hypothetical protein [Tanacetum cinerariifolium]